MATVVLIGSSLAVVIDLDVEHKPLSLCLIKFPFRKKDLPQLQQVLLLCNAVDAVVQLCVCKLSFLTVVVLCFWGKSFTLCAFSKEKLLIAPVLSFSKQCSQSFARSEDSYLLLSSRPV